MRRLVVCCDGTWNTAGQVAVTNVRRFYNALVDTVEDADEVDGHEQLTYYQSGVGTESGGLLGWLAGGVAGIGLGGNVMDAYAWLTTTCRPGDQIALFGFSRGAFTARSLAGMIAACGLIDTTCLTADAIERQIQRVYHRRYRPGRNADPSWSDGIRFTYRPERADRIPVDFIGCCPPFEMTTKPSLAMPTRIGISGGVGRHGGAVIVTMTRRERVQRRRHRHGDG